MRSTQLPGISQSAPTLPLKQWKLSPERMAVVDEEAKQKYPGEELNIAVNNFIRESKTEDAMFVYEDGTRCIRESSK